MMTKEDIRHYINRYIYAFNKYNIFGGIVALVFALMFDLIIINKNVFEISKTLTAILILFVSLVGMKLTLKKACRIQETCDCSKKMFKYPYRHLNYKTCSRDKTINELYYNARYSFVTHFINFVYRYNIFGGIIALVVSSLLTVVTANAKFFEFVNLLLLAMVFALTKVAIDFFLRLQEFCPCDCPYKYGQCNSQSTVTKSATAKTAKTVKTAKTSKTATKAKKTQAPRLSDFKPYTLEDIEDDVEQELSRVLKKKQAVQADQAPQDTTNDPITDKLNAEEGFRSTYRRRNVLNKVCRNNINSNTSKSDNIAECINKIKKDRDLRDFFRNLLESKRDYQCLVDSNSSTQLETCLTDFLSKNPKLAMDVATITQV